MNHRNFVVCSLLFMTAISTYLPSELKKQSLAAEDFDQEITLAGTWRGQSVCADKTSSCRDEEVVYHITQEAGSDIVNVNADKIVDGKVINMGSLVFTYDKARGTLSNSGGSNTWQFTIKGNQMEGVLRRDKMIFRNVTLHKN